MAPVGLQITRIPDFAPLTPAAPSINAKVGLTEMARRFRKIHALKPACKQTNLADQTSCRMLSLQACFQVRNIALNIFERHVFIDAMSLQKPVHLDAGQTEHAAKFGLGDIPGSEFLKGERFKRPT